MITENDRLTKLGEELLNVNEERRRLADKADFLKGLIYTEMVEINSGDVTVRALNGRDELRLKNNVRFNVKFDKDGLSGQVGVDRTELSYEGVSALVENGRLTAEQVGKFQAEGRSEFVTVRRRIVKDKKG
ncbi:hypothetical protein ACP26L_36120 (plasmid) [Paenibacillus sp. S-38]|uniref:hypothetical protein n=1 Tax=Paenibacillus sp. S-38 TaxID=3416710 RepID=UPI003CF47EC9